MLIFNEGLPRAGKSYDAVANHIIPAIKSGRHVFARLNGLNPYAIAQVSGVPEDEVRRLLHHIEAGDVLELFRITVDDDKAKTKHLHPALERDALFVVDECHEFWAASRADLPPEVEYFFAYHGQFGMDGVLISQWYKRLHDAVRGRVERKHLFRKLNFMQKFRSRKGKGGDPAKRYVCRQQIAMEPDKFAVLSSEEYEYRAEIFPCYQSYQGGAVNVEAYDPGFGGIFTRKQKIIYGTLAAFVVMCGFFGYSKYSAAQERAAERVAAREAERVQLQALAARPEGEVYQQPAQEPAAPVRAAYIPPTGVPHAQATEAVADARSPFAAYFFNLGKSARPRLAGFIDVGTERRGVIEWRVGNFQVLERMDTRDLERLGFVVTIFDGYALLESEGETILATSYPLDSPYSGPAAAGSSGGATMSGQETPPDDTGGVLALHTEGSSVHRYGGFRGEQTGPDGAYELGKW